MTDSPRIWAVIPAAGAGSRMNSVLPKQYLTVAGKPVILHVLEAFDRHPRVAGIVVAVAAGDDRWSSLRPDLHKPLFCVTGGELRLHSVLNGLDHLSTHAAADDWVLIHDAARPCLSQEDLDRLITALFQHPVGGLLGVRIADTVKRVDPDGRVRETLDRTQLWRAFTPQMFRLAAVRDALRDAVDRGIEVTDEAAAMERLGYNVQIVEGSPENIKVTYPRDTGLAEFYLTRRHGMNMKIGHGYDAHRFGGGHPLRLGGVAVPHTKGLLAHSDGDVVIHALCDALLGAASLGDLGGHFPDSDNAYAGMDSRRFLERINGLLRDKGYRLVNADVTIIAQEPKLAPYVQAMRETLAGVMGVAPDGVNVKATTTEGMGFTGREEGIAAHAVVLLRKDASIA